MHPVRALLKGHTPMTEPKFTPGPWELDREPRMTMDGGKGRLAISVYSRENLGRPLIRVGARTDDEAEVRANGRLIAAAPALYVALEAWQDYDRLLRRYNGPLSAICGSDAEAIERDYGICVEMTTAALALARGEGSHG